MPQHLNTLPLNTTILRVAVRLGGIPTITMLLVDYRYGPTHILQMKAGVIAVAPCQRTHLCISATQALWFVVIKIEN